MRTGLQLGIAGLGTVGAAVVKLVAQQASMLAQRAGQPVVITGVSARDRGRDRGVDLSPYRWFQDPVALAADPRIDVVVELIGGANGVARTVVETALRHGKHVVTANKALLAHHGLALATQAQQQQRILAFEAAVAGGIPVIKAFREGLAGNRIREIHGILNGTCNFILSEMRTTGRDFAEVLAEAQQLGYAEADPGFDIDGIDAAHKLAVLAAVVFGCAPDIGAVTVEGIRHISAVDIRYADQLGYRIKLLGIARQHDGRGIEQRVHPAMVPVSSPIAAVEGVFNAVVAEGDFVDKVTLVGRGAGAGPTASAVAADIVDIARGCFVPPFGVRVEDLASGDDASGAGRPGHRGAFYIRLMVRDQPGVIADVAAALRDQNVSMEAMLQRGRSPGGVVPVVLTTHETDEAAMKRALHVIGGLETVVEPPRFINIEKF